MRIQRTGNRFEEDLEKLERGKVGQGELQTERFNGTSTT
jgi:hypothetical protein